MTLLFLLVAMVTAPLSRGQDDAFGGFALDERRRGLSAPVPMGRPGLWSSMLQKNAPAYEPNFPQPLAAPTLSDPTAMGLDASCDDGVTNAMKDWNGYCLNHKCTGPTLPISTRDVDEINCLNVAEKEELLHYCMDHNLTYDHPIPQLGNHRPVWPVYGEYTCVPPQRWLHSVEHGGLVMLYHPCADPAEVEKLRVIVKGCLRKYIIAGYEMVPKEKPLALVAWGCRFLMNQVDEEKVKTFIRDHALHGNEANFPYDGDYNYGLIKQSEIPAGSTFEDAVLCPEP